MNPTETILGVAAVVAAITVIAHFVRKIYFIAKRIEDSLGVDEKGRTVTDRLERIEHQLFPNGGSSLTDKINQIGHEQKVMKAELDTVKTVLGLIFDKEMKDGS